MSLQSPPRYRYSLDEDWMKKAFDQIREIANKQNYPQLLGNKNQINLFIKTLIRTQKALHGWEKLLIDVLSQIEHNSQINTENINKKYPPES